jgi:SAM-dependent methyltransferase
LRRAAIRSVRVPALKALGAQLGALVLLGLLVRLTGLAAASLLLSLIQGVFAALLAALLRSDRWWLLLHLAFGPAVILALRIDAPAWMYVLPLCVLLLVYGSSFRSQVPLFLSNRRTVECFAAWLERRGLRILDAGSGTGSFSLLLARLRRDCSVAGCEQAFLPALLGRLSARGRPNVRLQRGDFWKQDFGQYDVVYAFLSPVPMSSLWQKASAEMRAQSWLVSNSFPVPEHAPDVVLDVHDRRRTRLYCYLMPGTVGDLRRDAG